MKIRTLQQAQQWLFRDLPASPRQFFKGEAGLARGRYLMQLLGNPQDSYKAVHIAATSGKGSMAYMIDSLLRAGGLTVGLHVSPHVYDFRERMQVNGKLVSEAELCRHINVIRPVAESMRLSEHGSPTYFEVALALAHLTFREHKVDYAVIETGLGGLYDASNLITREDKLAVLGQIGFDHIAILGNTIAEIAAQKAGIIQAGNHVIALWQDEEARTSFDTRAKQMRAKLEYINPSHVAKIHHMGPEGSTFDLNLSDWRWPNLTLAPLGVHQITNVSLALRSVQYLSRCDGWVLLKTNAMEALSKLQLPGRFEIHQSQGKTIVLDAAHNPQKMEALAKTLKQIFPHQRMTFVIALGVGKDTLELLNPLLPMAERFVLASVTSTSMHKLQSANKLARQLQKASIHNFIVEPDVDKALEQACVTESNVIVNTGSVYLLSQVKDALNLTSQAIAIR